MSHKACDKCHTGQAFQCDIGRTQYRFAADGADASEARSLLILFERTLYIAKLKIIYQKAVEDVKINLS